MEKGKKFGTREVVAYQTESIVSNEIYENEVGGITLFAFDKNQRLSEHTAPFDATIFVLEGKGEIRIGGVPHLLDAGESIIMPANVPHAVHAVEKFKMMLVMIRGL